MKFILSSIFFGLFVSLSVHAQFSVEAGINSNAATLETAGLAFSASDDGGVYLGAAYDTAISDRFGFQPAVLYSEDALQVPLSFKLKFGRAFSFMAGPSLLMLLSDDDTVDDGFNKNGLGYSTGLSYHISDKVGLIVRFYGDFNNRFDTTETILGDTSLKYTQLKAGIVYQF